MVTDESSSREIEDRGCCATAWHCDEGEWYNPCGKGNEFALIYMLKTGSSYKWIETMLTKMYRS